MSPEIVSLLVLVVMFVLATWRGVNMGLLGLLGAVAFGCGMLGMDLETALAGFPVDMFVSLVGLTFLFGFAQNNGAIDVLVHWCLRLCAGRAAFAPWVFFLLTAVLIALGALFAVAIIAPLALRFARRNGLNVFMTGLLVVHGALAGAFSPLSVYGIFIADFMGRNDFTADPWSLFLAPFVFNLVFVVVVFLFMRRRPGPGAESVAPALPGGGADASVRGASAGGVAAPEETEVRVDARQLFTLVVLAVFALGVVAFGLDVGILAIGLGVVLALVEPAAGARALGKVSWSVVVLICGVLTYIHVLEEAGTVDWVSAGISSIGVPLLAALLLFYMSGLVSALASSLGIIGVVIALAGPFLASGEVHVAGFVAALAIAATIVDISPFSTNGAMLLANVDEDVRGTYYRGMLQYAGVMCALGPGLAWLVVAVPTWLG
ncbi:SLC13 family permease [Brevibacterium samyangense]|uniref:SLC13 family permease n=1 Tax=Brevibacterium samyangense TaxID=366888 RepID=A0ABP5EUN5_9MICO